MRRRGRPLKPYVTSWGVPVPGLAYDTDRRWRVVATGRKFTEPDERLAVIRFRQLTDAAKSEPLEIDASFQPDPELIRTYGGDIHLARLALLAKLKGYELPSTTPDGGPEVYLKEVRLAHFINPDIMFAWLREQLINRPQWVAERVGIPQLASLANFPMPVPSPKLSDILRIFERTKEYTRAADKQKHVSAWEHMAAGTGAESLEDLTSDKLVAWRDQVREQYAYKMQLNVFGRVRAVLAHVRDDQAKFIDQIGPVLARMAVLKPLGEAPADDPRPIVPGHFRSLVAQAIQEGDKRMAAALLLALNCCMYGEEVSALTWDAVDLENATLVTRRTKRGRCIRAATLWPETITALRKLGKPAGGRPVLLSASGDRMRGDTLRSDYRELCVRAKVPVDRHTELASIRDGSYSAACNAPGVDEKYARVLAGHKAPGVQDKYVLRNPQIVKPACDAVYAAYQPFPNAAAVP